MIAKRVLDIGIAVVGLPLALPFLAIAAVLIKWETQGPALFHQRRIGRFGKTFICHKLRTMKTSTPNRASHEVAQSAVTRVGAFLRKTKLDEVPQLWNVLLGEMSVVGPRPCLPEQRELIDLREKLGVLEARPGITGLAQINDIDMSDPARLAEVDAQYVKAVSLSQDLYLMLMTVMGSGRGDRVKPV